MGELAREELSQRIVLRGLTERDVARFIEMTAGLEPPEALVAAVYKETEGNPFFVNEIVRLLVSDGRLEHPEEVKSWSVTIPQGVREVVGRRLDHLSEECNRVLTLASVLGREFGLDALERVSDLSGDRLLEVLEEAVAARVVVEVPRTVGRYSFHHAYIKETLYEELSATRRVRLHDQIGRALEGLYSAKPEPHLAELAYHFLQAAQSGDVDKAIDNAARAAQRALSLTAYEEAAGHYERALQALELKEPDEAQRCELLLALGDAQLREGDVPRAKETFHRAAEIARKLEAPEQLARAALGFGGDWGEATAGGELVVGLLEEALGALGEQDSALRARVLGSLAVAHYWSNFAVVRYGSNLMEERRSVSQEAIETARRIGDTAALAYAIRAKAVAIWGPANVEGRLADSTEVVQLAEELGDKSLPWRVTVGASFACWSWAISGRSAEAGRRCGGRLRRADVVTPEGAGTDPRAGGSRQGLQVTAGHGTATTTPMSIHVFIAMICPVFRYRSLGRRTLLALSMYRDELRVKLSEGVPDGMIPSVILGSVKGTGPEGKGLDYRFALAGHKLVIGSRRSAVR